jgi:hypothetical protein
VAGRRQAGTEDRAEAAEEVGMSDHVIKRIWVGGWATGYEPTLDDVPYGHWLLKRNGEQPWVDDHWLLMGPPGPMYFPCGSRTIDLGKDQPLSVREYRDLWTHGRSG